VGSEAVNNSVCVQSATGLFTKRGCLKYPQSSVFEVTYFSDSACSLNPTHLFPFDKAITTGVIGSCALQIGQNGQSIYSLKTIRANSSQQLDTFVFGSLNCTGEPIPQSSYSSYVNGSCNVLSISERILYYKVRLYSTPPPDPNVRLVLGQVDLNAAASDQNARIAGSSIGALCGFTVLLVIVSLVLDI
jgi:hypothetical protein